MGQSLYRFYFCLHSADLHQCLSEHIVKENIKIIEQENSIKALKQIFHNKLEQATIFKNEILNIYKNQPAFNGSFANQLKGHYESLKKEVADLKKIYEFNVSMNSSKLVYLTKAQTILASMLKLNESDVSQNVILDIVNMFESLDALQISMDVSATVNEKIISSCLTTYGASSEVKELVNDTGADKLKLANFKKAEAPVYETVKIPKANPNSIGENQNMAKTIDFMKLNSFRIPEINEPISEQFRFLSSQPPNFEKPNFQKLNFKKQQNETEAIEKLITPKKSYNENEKLKGKDVEKMVNDISKKYNLKFQKNEGIIRKYNSHISDELGNVKEDNDVLNNGRTKSRTEVMKSNNPTEIKSSKEVLVGEIVKLQKVLDDLKFKKTRNWNNH